MNAISSRLEAVLNRVIRDSGADTHLHNLEGRVVAVSIRGVNVTGYATVVCGAIRMIDKPDSAPDVTVSGTPGGLIELCRSGADSELFRDGSVRIEGCLLYTSPSPRDRTRSRMPSSA